jgi:hypothetical protein
LSGLQMTKWALQLVNLIALFRSYATRLKPSNRLMTGVWLSALITASIVVILMLAQAGVDDVRVMGGDLIASSRRCAQSFWQSQWPRWLGCAMAQHENLAGGLVGAGGGLFAGWLAYSGVQEQLRMARQAALSETRRNLNRAYREAGLQLDALRVVIAQVAAIQTLFPDGQAPGKADFAEVLRSTEMAAMLRTSSGAAHAPEGIADRLAHMLWRLEKIAEAIARQCERNTHLTFVMVASKSEHLVRDAVSALRNFETACRALMPEYESRLLDAKAALAEGEQE